MVAVVVLLAIYFPIAFYLNTNYVPPNVTLLHQPFRHIAGNAFASYQPLLGSQTDTAADPQRSTIRILENGKPIGPAHSADSDINTLGEGRYVFWSADGVGRYLIFSASDSSDPNTNGRVYEAVDPETRDPYQAQRRPHP